MRKHGILKSSKILITASFVAVILSGLSLSFIPLVSEEKGRELSAMAYIIAAVFWGGLIITFAASFLTKKSLCKSREMLIAKGIIDRKQRVGIISFSSNWKMLIIYGITILGMSLIVTDIVFNFVPEAIMFPIISATVLSFAFHCVIDGKYYKVYKLIKESVSDEKNIKA